MLTFTSLKQPPTHHPQPLVLAHQPSGHDFKAPKEDRAIRRKQPALWVREQSWHHPRNTEKACYITVFNLTNSNVSRLPDRNFQTPNLSLQIPLKKSQKEPKRNRVGPAVSFWRLPWMSTVGHGQWPQLGNRTSQCFETRESWTLTIK